jgi:hypothetical protein
LILPWTRAMGKMKNGNCKSKKYDGDSLVIVRKQGNAHPLRTGSCGWGSFTLTESRICLGNIQAYLIDLT